MRAGPKAVLKLIGTALLGGAILLGTVAPGAGPAAPPYWTLLVIVAVAFVLLWLAIWWHGGNRTDRPGHRGDPPGQEPPVPGRMGRAARSAPSTQSELKSALRSCRSAFLAIGLFSGLINLLTLSGAIYMLEIYDRVLPSRSVPTLVGLSILLVILLGGQGLLDFIRGRILVRIGGAVDEALGARVYSGILQLPLKVGRSGDGSRPIRDLDSVRGFLGGQGPAALFDLPWLPLYLIVIFAFHFVLGMTALAGAIVLVVLTAVAERLTRGAVSAATRFSAARNGLIDAGTRNAEVVAAMGMADALVGRWQGANADTIAEQRRVNDIAGGFGSISKVLRLLLQSAMLGVGAWLVIEQQATAGIIITSSILSARALAPVDLAIANWKGFVAARQGWQRLERLLQLLPPETERLRLPLPRENMMMLNVAVAAPGTQRPLVQDVTFGLEAGQAAGIIGPSGSGKSTLVRALTGVWQPGAGRVRLDGADLDQRSAAERSRCIGYLPQDVELFTGTIAENIARFEHDADSELVIAAARAAGAHDLIVGFRNGYQTEIGELGEALSAGQRQRIALARALYRDPFLVVLDEPNSNLDAEGEQALVGAILSVRERGGIVVLVAHRTNVLGAVDFILAMKNGRVQAFGPKEEVIGKLFPRLQSAAPPKLRLAGEPPASHDPAPAAGEA
jgi:ATP-binding cassette subfamily C protein